MDLEKFGLQESLPTDPQRAQNLRAAMMRRSDGPWELLACVAGDLLAVQRVKHALEDDQLLQGAKGPAVSPSAVGQRVEALSAADSTATAKLARRWPYPADGQDPWHLAAWMAALRHVRGELRITFQEADTPPMHIEAEAVFAAERQPQHNWATAVQLAEKSNWFYPVVRRLAACLATPDAITLPDLLGKPIAAFRLCRGCFSSFDMESKAYVREMIAGIEARPAIEQTLICEATRSLAPEMLPDLDARYAKLVLAAQDPRPLTGPCFVLLSNWRAP